MRKESAEVRNSVWVVSFTSHLKASGLSHACGESHESFEDLFHDEACLLVLVGVARWISQMMAQISALANLPVVYWRCFRVNKIFRWLPLSRTSRRIEQHDPSLLKS